MFPVPCRQAVYARSDDEAKSVNLERTWRSLPIQTLVIRGKIREVDELLRSDARARFVFREVHPELLFCAMNGGNPMLHRKKCVEGQMERRSLLTRVVGETVLNQAIAHGRAYLRRDLQDDDILDALVAAVAASHPNELVSLPADPPLDAYGLPMQMVYWPRVRASS